MLVLEISSKSTLLELLEISVERRGLLKATLSELHPAPGHVGTRGPRGPSFRHPWIYGKCPLWLGPRPSSPAAGEWKRTSERETLGVGASDTPQRTEEPLGTSVNLTAQGFLPTFPPHSRPPSSGLRLLFSHPGPCNCKSGAHHRRTWFPSSTFLHSAQLRQVSGPPRCHLVSERTRHTMWMLSWRGAEGALPVSDDREADTQEQEPGPAESAPGITPQRPGKPWHSCPQHLAPRFLEADA